MWYVQPGPVPKAANLPLFKAGDGVGTHAGFPGVIIRLLPCASIGLEDVTAPREALTEVTQQALRDHQPSLPLLNTEMSPRRKAVLQDRMALDIITATPEGACAVIQTGCCVLRPRTSATVPSLLNYMRTQN